MKENEIYAPGFIDGMRELAKAIQEAVENMIAFAKAFSIKKPLSNNERKIQLACYSQSICQPWPREPKRKRMHHIQHR